MGVPSWIDNEVIKVMKDRRAIQRVRELHRSIKVDTMDFNVCAICDKYYPCDTINALDGEM